MSALVLQEHILPQHPLHDGPCAILVLSIDILAFRGMNLKNNLLSPSKSTSRSVPPTHTHTTGNISPSCNVKSLTILFSVFCVCFLTTEDYLLCLSLLGFGMPCYGFLQKYNLFSIFRFLLQENFSWPSCRKVAFPLQSVNSE